LRRFCFGFGLGFEVGVELVMVDRDDGDETGEEPGGNVSGMARPHAAASI
jgi:hypothetical protein